MPMAERFIVLCRRPSGQAVNLVKALEPLGPVEVVSDTRSQGTVWYPDEMMAGFERLFAHTGVCPSVTAWERAWFHLQQTSGEFPANVWIVEDDVAGSPREFAELVEISRSVDADLSALELSSREDDPKWPHWHHGADLFTAPCHSFNPLCRLSSRLVATILEFRRHHGKFVFLELLFASLVAEHNYSHLDWRTSSRTSSLFGPFRYRPALAAPERGLCHPVKDPAVHREIFSSSLPE